RFASSAFFLLPSADPAAAPPRLHPRKTRCSPAAGFYFVCSPSLPPADISQSSSAGARTEEDNACRQECERSACKIPAVRSLSLSQPQPQQGCGDIDATIGGIGPTGILAGSQRQQPGKECERDEAGDKPQG